MEGSSLPFLDFGLLLDKITFLVEMLKKKALDIWMSGFFL
jgi:hypothetical protein